MPATASSVEQNGGGLRQKIESVTLEMSAAGARGDWDQAVELGALRRDLLEALFQSVTDPAEEVSLIERILESDRMLAGSAQSARARVAEELAGRREKKRAVSAYREAASREI